MRRFTRERERTSRGVAKPMGLFVQELSSWKGAGLVVGRGGTSYVAQYIEKRGNVDNVGVLCDAIFASGFGRIVDVAFDGMLMVLDL